MQQVPEELRETEGFIPYDQQTDRQKWAMGFLIEEFHRAGLLYEVNEERDADMRSALETHGYGGEEIAPIVAHINVATEWLAAQDQSARDRTEADIEAAIASERHVPPAPAKNR